MTIILTKDLNKKISRITYNFLNLPKEIMFMDGSYIHYTYDAAGTLLRKGYYVGEELELLDEEPLEIPDIEYTEEESINPMAQLMSNDEPIEEDLEPIEEEIPYTDVTDYCGNCVYENGTLKTILVEGGYITFDSSSQPVYHFYLQDHLGNNRVVANARGQVEQVNHYYPYGGLMAESTGGDVQRYKYNGKELDRMLGLDWYDYGARHYDGALTMWGTMDPLCEKYYNISPYVYCGNNPINAFDPDGRELYLVGSHDEQMALLQVLQSLTNDKLYMIRKTGQIYIGEHGNNNKDKTLSIGTSLVSGIIEDNHKMKISIETGEFREHDIYRKDSSNGKGTDVEIYVDLNDTSRQFLTYNEKTKEYGRDPIVMKIAVGHELIHGYRSMKGEASSDNVVEELVTTGLLGNYKFTENKLRKEHHENKRIKY